MRTDNILIEYFCHVCKWILKFVLFIRYTDDYPLHAASKKLFMIGKPIRPFPIGSKVGFIDTIRAMAL